MGHSDAKIGALPVNNAFEPTAASALRFSAPAQRKG
jgi:hypothetical protein